MHALFRPVDIAPLVFFRIVFGLVMFWEVGRYFGRGWIASKFIEPEFFFTYYGFDWVSPLPGSGMYLVFALLGIFSVLIVLGLFYKAAITGFFVCFTYVFLIDQTNYLNHFYLVILLSFLMIFLPANRAFSDDLYLWPRMRTETVPAWTLWLLRGQLAIVYFFAAVAKVNGDWLIRGEPIRTWMQRRNELPVFGQYLADEPIVYAIAWGGFLFDLLIVPLLLWRKTRILGFSAALAFHLTNYYLFNIGIFPWLMIAATTLFFNPSWHRQLLERLLGAFVTSEKSTLRSRKKSGKQAREDRRTDLQDQAAFCSSRQRYVVTGLLAAYMSIQVILPLRHHLYPNPVAWSEDGHMFSWRMLLRTKSAHGEFFVRAYDPREDAWDEFFVRGLNLTERQERKMWTRPDMILQYAHHLAEEKEAQGYRQVDLRAFVNVSLNARPRQPSVDPDINLADYSRTLRPTSWLLPLGEPAP